MTIAQQLNITEFPFEIKTNAGLPVYTEDQNGGWYRFEYNANGEIVRYETSTGYWYTWEYNDRGMRIRYEDSGGYWSKTGYDADGNEIWYLNSNGVWTKTEYDADGDIIYRETQDGVTYDERNHKAVVLTMDQIAQKLGIDVKDLKIKK